jgi:hypothetical protein
MKQRRQPLKSSTALLFKTYFNLHSLTELRGACLRSDLLSEAARGSTAVIARRPSNKQYVLPPVSGQRADSFGISLDEEACMIPRAFENKLLKVLPASLSYQVMCHPLASI